MTKTYAKGAVIAFLLSLSQLVFSQTGNISINLAGAASHSPAILDLSDASNAHLGFLMPNVSLVSATDATTIPSPTAGMIVWNTNSAMTGGLGKGFYYYTGSQWNYIYNSGTSNSLLNLTAGAGLSGSPYNGSVAQTWSVLYGSAASTAVQGNTQFTITPGTGISGGGTITEGTGGTLTITNNGVVTANNGLTVTANNAQLGGTNLTQQTNIPLNNNTLTVTGSAVTTTFATTGAVGIGNAPNSSAVLDVNSITQGFLPPRLTAAQIAAISTPAIGLIVYNTSTNCLELNTSGTNTGWNDISCACTAAPGTPGTIVPSGPASASVCETQTGQTYSVPLVANATSYNWTVPSEVGIWTGQGGPVVTISTYTSTGTGIFSVTASNNCGTSAASTLSATIYTGNPTGSFTSGYPTGICSTGSNTISLTGVGNYSTITWSAPNSITSSGNITAANLANATSLTLSGGTSGTGVVTVTLSNPCGSTLLTSSVITTYVGGPTGTITTGYPTAACSTATNTITLTGAANYQTITWTAPTSITTAANVTAAQNTTSLTLTGGTGGTGVVSVTLSNPCGSVPLTSSSITIYAGNPAGSITTGYPTAACNTATNTITLTGAANYSTITWTAPTSITTAANVTAAQNTTSITLTGGTGGTGVVTATLTNNCGTIGPLSTSSITSYPGNPTGSITAGYPTVACNTATNTITLTGAASYQTITWSAPTTITTAANVTAAQNTTSLTLNGGTGGTGQVSVTLSNTCGSTPLISSNIEIDAGDATGSITPGYVTSMCSATSNTISLTGASDYSGITWTAPATITSAANLAAAQNTTSLILNAGTGGTAQVTVTLANACRSVGPLSTTNITVSGGNASHGGPTTYAWNGGTTNHSIGYSQGTVQSWVVPACVGSITVTITGGSAGLFLNPPYAVGAIVTGTITVVPTHTLYIMAGGQGEQEYSTGDGSSGGGGSFLWDATSGLLLAVAGGGGGTGSLYGTYVGANAQTSMASVATFESATAGTYTDAGGTGGGANSGGTSDASWGGGGGAGWGENGFIPSTNNTGMTVAYYPRSVTNAGYGGVGWNIGSGGATGGYGGGGGSNEGGGGGGGYNGGGGGKAANAGGGGGGGNYFSSDGGHTASLPTSVTSGTMGTNGSVVITY